MGKLSPLETAVVVVLLGTSMALLFTQELPSWLPFHSYFSKESACPLGFTSESGVPNPHNFQTKGAADPPKQSDTSGTTMYTNCNVWTADPAHPTAAAFAVAADGRFLAVGTFAEVSAATALLSPTLVDLNGAFVTPGLIDAHLHFIPGGLSLSRLDLRQAASKQEFIAAVRAAAQQKAGASPPQWILGGNWDESRWGGEPPTAAWIDSVTGAIPAFLLRMDAHQALANSAALRLANLTAETANPAGGVIGRHPVSSAPTGLLVDAAMQLVAQHIPKASVTERREGMLTAQRHALERGITSVHDMGAVAFQEGVEAAWRDLEQIYLPAANDGSLRVRVRAFVPLPTWRRMAERVKLVGFAHPKGYLSWGGVKEFYDGSLGSRTALMHEPYGDAPHTYGALTVDTQRFGKQVAAADAAGLQVAVHAIGDKAVDEVLEVFAAVLSSRPPKESQGGKEERRHRIEHAQHLSGPAAAQRFAELGVVATPNPLHLQADAGILEARLGAGKRAANAYAFKTLCNGKNNSGGAICAYSSDWPVVPLNPLGTLRAAALHGRHQSISPAEALHGMTNAAAHAGLQEEEVGLIAAGLRADFVVFNNDILVLGEAEVEVPAVLQTFVDGKCEFGCAGLGKRALTKDEL